ncbi:penicillin-binding protein 2 [Sphingomonas sp. LB-2]|uniref:peptidoglycan D,D-transpeptidase FtsI family protein n=1 Tax=Sphingomonas caeni TaxID=2984949 RepID=UPI002231EF50|nr:penicillin-binding protein 2 [Sphingomonas caeni]MCW3847542.1 penicillin-binding protein 2 [Sphingomonas caeni]
MTVLVAPSARARRPGGARKALVEAAQVRLAVLAMIFGAAMFAILVRLAVLAFAATPAAAQDPLAGLPPRGDIVDRNGQPLAQTISGWSIAIHPNQVIGDKGVLAQQLAQLFPEKNAGQYFALLNSGSSFAWLKRRARPELVKQANALGNPGIELMREPDRLYPQSTMAAHVLGYLGADGHGVAGMEKLLDTRLTGPDRMKPIALSIDVRVQGALENELATAMTDLQAQGAAGVVLDVDTGEIVAMTSLPSYNPNAIQGPPPRNNVTQSVYELGSTFKPIAVAAAIDSGTITSMSRRFDATKPLEVGRFKIHDDPGDEQFRWLNIPETLIYSSNIATARIADELGADKLQDMFRRLHFDQREGLEIEGGARPLWPSYWGRITVMTAAYGHGIAVTPLHLASAYAALVNGGIWRPATLFRVDPGKASPGERVLQQATSDRMRQLLRMIVLQGTGRNGEAPGYRVIGKTGTAEAAAGGGYDKSRNVSTFAAAFPADAPRYVVVAMLDSPKANARVPRTTAAWTAAPVVRRVIARTGPLLGVLPDTQRDVDVSQLLGLVWHRPGTAEASDR